MMYNHLSVLGCSFRRFRRPTDKTHDYTRIGGSESLSASPSPLVSKNVNPIVSSSLSTSNVSLSQPNFESPVVQFLGQEKSPLLCDIAADSDFAVTNLESENPNNVLLPDILSSHTSNWIELNILCSSLKSLYFGTRNVTFLGGFLEILQGNSQRTLICIIMFIRTNCLISCDNLWVILIYAINFFAHN